MITTVNEFRKIFESKENLLNLAQEYRKQNPLPEDEEFADDDYDCISETNKFIKWAQSKGYNNFKKLWGAPSKSKSSPHAFDPKFGNIWMHSVVLDVETNLVIDLMHSQFDETVPIAVYSEKEFRSNFPNNVDDDGNIIF